MLQKYMPWILTQVHQVHWITYSMSLVWLQKLCKKFHLVKYQGYILWQGFFLFFWSKKTNEALAPMEEVEMINEKKWMYIDF